MERGNILSINNYIWIGIINDFTGIGNDSRDKKMSGRENILVKSNGKPGETTSPLKSYLISINCRSIFFRISEGGLVLNATSNMSSAFPVSPFF